MSVTRFRILIPIILFALLGISAGWCIHWITSQPSRQSPSNEPQSIISGQKRYLSAEAGSPRANAISMTFTPEVQYWADQIADWSSEFSLPPNLVAIVMQIESCGAPQVTSSAGAIGLFQVMPFHFDRQEDALDPETNARRGLSYLSDSYHLSAKRIDHTLAGYNGGHSVIGKPSTSWAAETRRYVNWGIGIWNDVHASNGSASDTLDRWLTAGGDHLCQLAETQLRN